MPHDQNGGLERGPRSAFTEVAIGLGSNRGRSLQTLRATLPRLRDFVADLRVSRLYVSAPIGSERPQPDFLNACCVGRSVLEADALIRRLLAVERAFGRSRAPRDRPVPRELDLDLLLYGEQVIRGADVSVPHPRLHEREFVLRPLSELAPDWTVPDPSGGSRGTVAQLLADLPPQRLFASRLQLEV